MRLLGERFRSVGGPEDELPLSGGNPFDDFVATLIGAIVTYRFEPVGIQLQQGRAGLDPLQVGLLELLRAALPRREGAPRCKVD
jgi:hypothetical protein